MGVKLRVRRGMPFGAVVPADAERSEMGARGRKLVEEKYTWDAVVKAMVKGYEGLTCWKRK